MSLNGSVIPKFLDDIDNENVDDSGLIGSSSQFFLHGIEYEQARMCNWAKVTGQGVKGDEDANLKLVNVEDEAWFSSEKHFIGNSLIRLSNDTFILDDEMVFNDLGCAVPIVEKSKALLNIIVSRMAYHNPIDSLQSSGDDSNTEDTGNNPGDVKASSAPKFFRWENWVKFVDYCNLEKFLAKSKRNNGNRAELQNTIPKDPKSIQTGPNELYSYLRRNLSKKGKLELESATKKLRKDLNALTKYVGNIPVGHFNRNFQECRFVGCPWRIVTHDVIVGADPIDMRLSVALGDDFDKVVILDIVD
ncbi:hypothetical protein GIB67_032314, partial [Kingdonia uniflora]